jgi:DNA repair protein RadC
MLLLNDNRKGENMKDFKKALLDGDFVNRVQEAVKGEILDNPNRLLNVLSPLIAQHKHQEKFYVIYLDAKNKTLLIEPVFTGSLSGCSVYPREIIKKALDLGAAALIFAHNHPSGDLVPSEADKKITKLLIIAADVHGITIHDHLVINETEFLSFNCEGILQSLKDSWDNFQSQNAVEF